MHAAGNFSMLDLWKYLHAPFFKDKYIRHRFWSTVIWTLSFSCHFYCLAFGKSRHSINTGSRFACLVFTGINILSVRYRIMLTDKNSSQTSFFNPQLNFIIHQIKTLGEFFTDCKMRVQDMSKRFKILVEESYSTWKIIFKKPVIYTVVHSAQNTTTIMLTLMHRFVQNNFSGT